jgi:hypothetical protein
MVNDPLSYGQNENLYISARIDADKVKQRFSMPCSIEELTQSEGIIDTVSNISK